MARPRKVPYPIVISEYQRLRSLTLTARKLGLSHSQVRTICRAAGVTLPRGHALQPVRL